MYHRRSPAGTAFSVTREGSGAVARAGTPAMRKLRPVLKCIRCNLVAQALPPERRVAAPADAARKPPAAAQNPDPSRANPPDRREFRHPRTPECTKMCTNLRQKILN